VRYVVLGLIASISLLAAQSIAELRLEASSVKSRSVDDTTPFRVSFEPGRFVTVNAPLSFWFTQVYPNPNLRVEGQPSWFGMNGFDINAKAEGVPSRDQMLRMLRSLLMDRFKLAVHYETRDEDTFALVRENPTRLGPQLRPTNVDCTARAKARSEGQVMPALPAAANGADACRTLATSAGIVSGGLTVSELANNLASLAGRPVIDKTGLTGHYEVTLKVFNGPPEQHGAIDDVDFFTAVREQLGLRLVAEKNAVQVLVIDHIERPNEN
jgi:uncharacterized protein (TIGR03435 family)